MSLEHKYAVVPANAISDLDLEEIQATFDYDVIIQPSLNADGTYLVEYCGNKPYTLYGTTIYTDTQVKAKRQDPNDPWYVDPDVI